MSFTMMHNNNAIELEVKTATQLLLGLLIPMNQQAQKGLAGVANPGYQGKI